MAINSNYSRLKIDEAFEKANSVAYPKFDLKPNFLERDKIHNWRNYISHDFQLIWEDLTEREKKILFIGAVQLASEEEWD